MPAPICQIDTQGDRSGIIGDLIFTDRTSGAECVPVVAPVDATGAPTGVLLANGEQLSNSGTANPRSMSADAKVFGRQRVATSATDKFALSYSLDKFGLKYDGSDETTKLQGAIDAIAGDVVGELIIPIGAVITAGPIVMAPGIMLRSAAARMQNVNLLATPIAYPMARINCIGSGNAITFPSGAYGAEMHGIALDMSAKPSGDGVVFDDAAGVKRSGQTLRNVLVYKAPGRGVYISAGNKEVDLDHVFIRGGDSSVNRITQYGLENRGVDNQFNRVWIGFCAINGLLEAGQESRYSYVDSWGSGSRGVVVEGTASDFYRLQIDSGDAAALHINGARNCSITGLVSINNGAVVSEADVIVSGQSTGVQFVSPRLRAAGANTTAAFDEQNSNYVQVVAPRIDHTYQAEFTNRALAYWTVSDAARPAQPSRASIVPRTELFSNHFFNSISGGVPAGFQLKGTPTVAALTSSLPAGIVRGATITSSNSAGGSGLEIILDADVEKYAGRRIRIQGMFKGSGLTWNGNQTLEIRWGAEFASETIPNDNAWGFRALDVALPSPLYNLAIRIYASRDTSAGIILQATAISISVY